MLDRITDIEAWVERDSLTRIIEIRVKARGFAECAIGEIEIPAALDEQAVLRAINRQISTLARSLSVGREL